MSHPTKFSAALPPHEVLRFAPVLRGDPGLRYFAGTPARHPTKFSASLRYVAGTPARHPTKFSAALRYFAGAPA